MNNFSVTLCDLEEIEGFKPLVTQWVFLPEEIQNDFKKWGKRNFRKDYLSKGSWNGRWRQNYKQFMDYLYFLNPRNGDRLEVIWNHITNILVQRNR